MIVGVDSRASTGFSSWKPREKISAVFTGAVSLSIFLSVASLVFLGKENHAYSVRWQLPVAGEGLSFDLNGFCLPFLFSASLVFSLAFVFSIPYINHERQAHGMNARPLGICVFYFSFTGSLLAVLLIFLSGDLFTLFFFFEALTLLSFPLVLYEGTPDSQRFSGLYLFMSLVGGLLVLGGVMVLKARTGSTQFLGLRLLNEQDMLLTSLLLTAGFGVKAGVFGLHMWLPRAHPVAPAPASAVLSGVMIKVGAYGILRVVLAVGHKNAGEFIARVLAVLGLANIFAGGLGALTSSNLKKVLAYSSISQIGYILTGISTVPSEELNALSISGVILHVLNHGLFKSLLFMLAGYLLMTRGTVQLITLKGTLAGKSGGRSAAGWDIPGVLGFLGGGFSIIGLPGFGGFISKTLIHDGLIVASHSGDLFWVWTERGFLWGTYLTSIYFMRLFFILFARDRGRGFEVHGEISTGVHGTVADLKLVGAVFLTETLILMWIGSFPHYWIRVLLFPALFSLYGDPSIWAYPSTFPGESPQLKEVLHELEHFEFWGPETVKPIIIALAIGVSLNMLFSKRMEPQEKVEKDVLVETMASYGRNLCRLAGERVDLLVERLYDLLTRLARALFVYAGSRVETCLMESYLSWSAGVKSLVAFSRWVEDRMGVAWHAVAWLMGYAVPLTAGSFEQKDQAIVDASEKAAKLLILKMGESEKIVSMTYDGLASEGARVVEHLGQVEELTGKGYVKGEEVTRKLITRGVKGALKLRPDFLVRQYAENTVFLSRASLALVGVTLVLVVAVILVLVVI